MSAERPTEQERMQEVKDLIRFYERRGANWLLAAEYTLGLRSGELDRREHWLNDYIRIPRNRVTGRPRGAR